MNPTTLSIGHVVQIDPSHDPVFGGCLMVVTESRTWGVIGYVLMPHQGRAVQAFYRCPWKAIELVGLAWWVEAEGETNKELTPA